MLVSLHSFLFFLDNVKLKADCCFDHQNNLCIKDVSYMWSTERTSLHCNLHSKKIKSGCYKHWNYSWKKNIGRGAIK